MADNIFGILLVLLFIVLVWYLISDIRSESHPKPSERQRHPQELAHIREGVRRRLTQIDVAYNGIDKHFPYDDAVKELKAAIEWTGMKYRVYVTAYGFLIKIKNGPYPFYSYHMPMRRRDES